jgi:hypothetical protein
MIIEKNVSAFPVEIKSGKTVASDFFDELRKWQALSETQSGALVYGGSESYERAGFRVVPWNDACDLAD